MKITLTPYQTQQLNEERLRTNHAYLSMPEFAELVIADWLDGGLLIRNHDDDYS